MKAYRTGSGVWQTTLTHKGKRVTIYLGKQIDCFEAARQAEVITNLLDKPVASWSADRDYVQLPERVRESLQRRFDFCRQTELELLFEKHALTKADCKQQTRSNYRTWYRKLNAFFQERSPSSLTREDAERFKSWCLGDSSLSKNYVARGLRTCRSIFGYGQAEGVLLRNPFDVTKIKNESDVSKVYYVDRLLFDRVLLGCRNDQERLLLALARFGGLRIPSEIRNMRFIDFGDKVIRIHPDTKTGYREVPFLPEIRDIFVRLQGEPEDFVFCKILRGKSGARRMLQRVLKESGIPAWAKLYINLRSSCITDDVTIGYSEKALDSMFGNSARVREKFYVQLRKEAEYRRILEDNRRLVDYLRYRNEESDGGVLEPSEIREFVIAQRIANSAISR